MTGQKDAPPAAEIRRVQRDPSEIADFMREVFESGGAFRFAPTGTSMLPLLREKRDTVLLLPPPTPPEKIKKYDVILYRRQDGKVVLHRVVGFDGDFLCLCGDGQTHIERGVAREAVLGVLCSMTRGKKDISVNAPAYRVYSVLWVALRPVRRVFRALLSRARRLCGKLKAKLRAKSGLKH